MKCSEVNEYIWNTLGAAHVKYYSFLLSSFVSQRIHFVFWLVFSILQSISFFFHQNGEYDCISIVSWFHIIGQQNHIEKGEKEKWENKKRDTSLYNARLWIYNIIIYIIIIFYDGFHVNVTGMPECSLQAFHQSYSECKTKFTDRKTEN